MPLPSILEKIIKAKRLRLNRINEEYKKNIFNALDKESIKLCNVNFYEKMSSKGLSIIGEVKKGSPSCGVIKEKFNPLSISREYENVVDAISVLTEEDYFFGRKEYLNIISKSINLPILRKDFIIDEFQIYESKALGASCVLLITSILTQQQLNNYLSLCQCLSIDALVEVHTEEELFKALNSNAKIIGINNRNLHTFKTNIDTTIKLCEKVPEDRILISESGFHTKEDVMKLKGLPVNGILVGESFMRAKNIKEHGVLLKYAL